MTAKHSKDNEPKWRDYRMWRQQMRAVAVGGNSVDIAGEWKPTAITFRARTQSEAQKKAERFWRDAQLGAGSMVCIPDGEQLRAD